MISSISGFLSLNNLDMTSGANDVIVVRHPNGRLFSTPFNVRFGKVKVLRPSDKVVQVEVNDKPTSAVMKTGPDGEAFWLKPTKWSERGGGRPESPVVTTEAFLSSSRSNSHNNSSNGGNAATSHPTEPIQETASLSSVDIKTESHAATEPLLEEDKEGHLKVNSVARQSVDDIKEVQLAEEAVVAAKMAMQRIAEMTMEYDDYLREAALQEEKEGILSRDVSEMESRSDAAFEKASLSVTDIPSAATAAVRKDAEKPVIVSVEEQPAKEEDENNGSKTPTKKAEKGTEEVHMKSATTPKREKKVDPENSIAASDEGYDTCADDYLFEDAMNPDEYVVDLDEYAVGDTLSNIAMRQEAADNGSGMLITTSSAADPQNANSADFDEEDNDVVYFTRTLIPTEADLHKLNLVDGHNKVRYITHSSLRGEVAVDANVYLWDSTDRLVVSDVDGTITRSDIWGHLMPLIGVDWTHPGICSLYSKIDRNGYKFVYLTARSVSQVGMTRNFLWKIEQDGFRLPKGPVMTAPQRFFTALTQEVSKKSHVFKIACLKSVLDTFPPHSKPFYAGFGNRFNDVVSYTATQIPQHKIFIIDPNSVLHVYNVKQTYKNLAHLVDVTFPPVVKRIQHHHLQSPSHLQREASEAPSSPGGFTDPEVGSNGSFDILTGTKGNGSLGFFSSDRSESVSSNGDNNSRYLNSIVNVSKKLFSDGNSGRGHTMPTAALPETHVEVAIDQEFDSFLYWRMHPADLVAPKKETKENDKTRKELTKKGPSKTRRWLTFSLRSSSQNNNNNTAESNAKGGSEEKTQTVSAEPPESTASQYSTPQKTAALPLSSFPSPSPAAYVDTLTNGDRKTEGSAQKAAQMPQSLSAEEKVRKGSV